MSMVKESTSVKAAFDTEYLEDLLLKGCVELGISLDESQIRQLLAYLALLSRWNTVYNLTAIREPEAMMTHHILDSLAVIKALKNINSIIDVGSGAGFPGLVLAIALPEMQVSLIDTVHKKTAFLAQAKAELRLKNVTVHTGRVEKLRTSEKYDAIISRAFSDLSTFSDVSAHLLSDDGNYYAMKGIIPVDEIDVLSAGLKLKAVVPLKVPFLDAERHLIVLEKQAV